MKHKNYVSEFEQFLNGYLNQHPDIGRDQLMGWRIWWERPPVPPQELTREQASHLPRSSYYYD